MGLVSKEQLIKAIAAVPHDHRPLYDLLFPILKDTPAAAVIAVYGDQNITLPASGQTATETYTYNALDQYNDPITGGVFSLQAAKTGVSIDGSTGVLTVGDTATAGTVTIVVTIGAKTGTITVTLAAA